MSLIIKITKIVFLFVVATSLFAEEVSIDETSSELWLNYAQDELDAIDYSLDLDIGLSLDDSLLISLGHAESELLNETIQTNKFLLGYSTIRLAPWANTVFYEYWGKANELVIESLGYDANYFASDWSAGFEIEYRKIDFFTREFTTGQRRIEVDSYGFGLHTGIINGNLRWSVSGKWYDYSEEIQRLNTLRGIFILGLKNFDHASSLNTWAAETKIYYRFISSGVGIGYSYAVAELDDAESATIALLYDFNITNSVTVETELGRTLEEQDIETDYASIGLGFRF